MDLQLAVHDGGVVESEIPPHLTGVLLGGLEGQIDGHLTRPRDTFGAPARAYLHRSYVKLNGDDVEDAGKGEISATEGDDFWVIYYLRS